MNNMSTHIYRLKALLTTILLGFSISLFAQQITVKGTVTDANSGEPVVGAGVIEDATKTGTITDAEGKYSIKVNENSILKFSSIGYETRSVQVNGRAVIDVTLSEQVEFLNDVVVIGYGSTTKKEVTGSVASVKREEFLSGDNSSPFDLINGKIAGLSIIRSGNGDPNSDVSIQLRGNTTMSAGATPLVVIDNVAGGSLESIDPSEIESIDVLKDGSAAAIYGTRGTNGVILITTKKGNKEGTVNVDFSSYLSLQKTYRKLDMLTADEFRKVIAEGHTGFDGGADTDWLDAISRDNPISQYYNIGISGGNKNVNYRASLSYNDEKGIIINSNRKDIRGRFNITQTAINDRLTLNYNFNYISRRSNPTDTWAVQQAVRRNPTEPIYDKEDTEHGGYYTNSAPFQYYNPVALPIIAR